MADPDPHQQPTQEVFRIGSQIDKTVGADRNLTPQQQFAARLAYCTAAYCAVALIAIFITRIWLAPQIGTLPTDQAKMEIFLKNSRELAEINNNNARSLFEMSISFTALPLLTTLVGFLIGRASKHSD